MSDMSDLEAAMKALGTAPPANSKKDEYSGPDGPDGGTLVPSDPILDTVGVPVAPPVTAAARGRLFPGSAAAPPSVPAVDYPAEMPEIAPEAVAAPAEALRLVFTGVSGAGKSTLTQQLGLQELQIQDPIQDLYDRYFPGQPPPGDFINTLLIWGEGVVDPKAPVTPARLLFVDFWRNLETNKSLALPFGTRGYWQNRLVVRAQELGVPVVVTTCTNNDILTKLKEQGFKHFHVAASNQTLATRKKRQGANDQLANALTNQLIREVSMRPQGSTLPCVWFDSVPAPSPRFLTIETLRQVLLSEKQSVITGE